MSGEVKKPGIVIFVAVLHFFTAAFFSFLSLTCVLAMLFGAAWGIDDYVTRQMSQFSAPNLSFGITLIFSAALFVFVGFAAFFMAVAFGLLKGKKFVWYIQVAFSTLGLLSLPMGFFWTLAIPVLPMGSILNIIILIFFFRPPAREFFKV